jgi:hypothetical protein
MVYIQHISINSFQSLFHIKAKDNQDPQSKDSGSQSQFGLPSRVPMWPVHLSKDEHTGVIENARIANLLYAL